MIKVATLMQKCAAPILRQVTCVRDNRAFDRLVSC
jgi:hypothetical protein